MHRCLSFPDTLIAIVIAGFLCIPHAMALVSDYSTDMEEPDIMTVKNRHHRLKPEIKEEINVQMNIEDALIAAHKPVRVRILNDQQQEINAFTTRDRYVYMHLPEGKYTIIVEGQEANAAFNVAANERSLQSYTIQPLYHSYAENGGNHTASLQEKR